jgi:hypothetical protein
LDAEEICDLLEQIGRMRGTLENVWTLAKHADSSGLDEVGRKALWEAEEKIRARLDELREVLADQRP